MGSVGPAVPAHRAIIDARACPQRIDVMCDALFAADDMLCVEVETLADQWIVRAQGRGARRVWATAPWGESSVGMSFAHLVHYQDFQAVEAQHTLSKRAGVACTTSSAVVVRILTFSKEAIHAGDVETQVTVGRYSRVELHLHPLQHTSSSRRVLITGTFQSPPRPPRSAASTLSSPANTCAGTARQSLQQYFDTESMRQISGIYRWDQNCDRISPGQIRSLWKSACGVNKKEMSFLQRVRGVYQLCNETVVNLAYRHSQFNVEFYLDEHSTPRINVCTQLKLGTW